MIFNQLQPAATAADTLVRLSNELKRNIDSARRGHSVHIDVDAVIAQARALKKELPRYAA